MNRVAREPSANAPPAPQAPPTPVATVPAEARPSPAVLLDLYERMVLLRQFELAVQTQYRAGRIPGFLHLYVGQEAVAVGICAHLEASDGITSTHRGHGHALAKGLSPRALMAELYGRDAGCCGGRGGSMHLYEPDVGLFGTNGLVGGGIPIAVGIGLSARLRQTQAVGVAFFGDGAINHGAFHESVNLAGALRAPVIFVCENNLYATATPLATATRNTDVASRASAYGIAGSAVDGNDVCAVWMAAREAVGRARSGGGPALIEARTYRTVGHHEGDPLFGTYRTREELEGWLARCPIARLAADLLDDGLATRRDLEEREERARAAVDAAVAFAEAAPHPRPSSALDHAWAPLAGEIATSPRCASVARAAQQTWTDAVRDGIAEEMRHNPHLLYFGEGIGERGGAFGQSKGLWQEFGGRRVIDTPICELGFTGAGIGAAATGCPVVADLMFGDFIFEAASQIVHQAAKLHYVSNGRIRVPLVIRAGIGPIKNAGPHHSGSYHPIWAHVPGLVVGVPSTPADAKGLVKSALRGANPVLLLEPKGLFSMKGLVPAGEHLVPFGNAAIVREGRDLTLVTCGALVHRCLDAAAQLEQAEGLSCEVIDLRTIVPLDVATVVASVGRTHRLLIVDEAYATCGLGGELAATMMEEAFDQLDAPVGRVHTEPVAHPLAPPLEDAIVVSVKRIVAAARSVVGGVAPRVTRAAAAAKGPADPVPCKDSLVPPRAAPRAGAVSSPARSTSDGVPLIMPNQDLTITEGKVVRWLKQVGEEVTAGEELVEVETAKATTLLEAPATGRLAEILVCEGEDVCLGEPMATIAPMPGGLP